MKILYVATILSTINAFLVPHIEMLIGEGYSVDIACNVQSQIKEELETLDCQIYNITFRRSPLQFSNVKAYRQIKKIIVDGKYNIIHTHTPNASAIIRLVCKNLPNVKVFYTAHGFHFYKGAPILNWFIYYPIERWLSRYTDTLITINNEDYNLAIKGLNAKRTFLVNGVGICLDKFKPQISECKKELRKKYGYTEDTFILFYAAELNRNKNQDLLINAVYNLKNGIPNFKLLLAGTGPLKEDYKIKVKNLGLHEHVEILGFRNDVKQLLGLSDIVVASSRREGLPVNIMEAMATGLPLVVTDVRGHRDLVVDGENGFVVDVKDVNSFSKAIIALATDQKQYNKFQNKNLNIIKSYSVEVIVDELKKIYDITC